MLARKPSRVVSIGGQASGGKLNPSDDTAQRSMALRTVRGSGLSGGSAPSHWWSRLIRSLLSSAPVKVFGRSLIAVTGGLFLLVPMIIMSFKTSREACLITTSVATVVFSLILANYTTASNDTLLAVTATYAAVLVVFVGNALAHLHDTASSGSSG